MKTIQSLVSLASDRFWLAVLTVNQTRYEFDLGLKWRVRRVHGRFVRLIITSMLMALSEADAAAQRRLTSSVSATAGALVRTDSVARMLLK